MKTAVRAKPKRTQFVEVNGTQLYYEVHGSGEPLILLHAYTQSSVAWKRFVEEYSIDYEVYLIDMRGHGRSDQFRGRFSVSESAKDVIELIKYLKIERTKGIGVSLGGDVLLQICSLNPEIIESMIIIGANGDWDARDFPEMLRTFNVENIGQFQWMYDFAFGGAEQIKAIIEQLGNYKIKLSEDEIRNIRAKTLLVLGDSDGQVSIESVVRLNRMLEHSHLWIVPNTSHFAHDGDNKDEFVRVSRSFLGRSRD